jgi:hypothetical protein
MEHDFVVATNTKQIGLIYKLAKTRLRNQLKEIARQINEQKLRSQKFIMNKADYDDIVAWGKENDS